MTQEERTRMLHLTLEAEGLLTLMGERADQTPPEVLDLLREKIALLAELMPRAAKEADTPIPAPISEPEPDTEFIPEPEPEPLPEPQPQPAKGFTVADSATAKSALDMRNALTLNDRFRFRRALFNNSNDELDEALDAINMMADADEAQQYFMEDLCWDPDNEDVKEFMRLVQAHFNN